MSVPQSSRLLGTIGSRNLATWGRSVAVCAGLSAIAVGTLAFYLGVAQAALILSLLGATVLAIAFATDTFGPEVATLVEPKAAATVANPRKGEAGAYFPAD